MNIILLNMDYLIDYTKKEANFNDLNTDEQRDRFRLQD